MIIFFVRHASAGQNMVNPKKDEKRPLDSEGIEQCNSVGRALAALNVQPDVVISSPQTCHLDRVVDRQRNRI
jgi:phosphohistidine phosphatase